MTRGKGFSKQSSRLISIEVLKKLKQQANQVISDYGLVQSMICYSSDKTYAIVAGIQPDGVSKVSVVAPDGMSPEKMESILEIAKRTYVKVVSPLLNA